VLRPLCPRTLVLSATLLLAGLLPARAHDVVPLPFATQCWEDVRLFDSLSTGTVDYCRGHLRYVPGALDCWQFVDEVCLLVFPSTGELTDARTPRARIPIACPAGRPPPVCRRLDVR